MALALGLMRAFARSESADDRQFLGRYDPFGLIRAAAAFDRRRGGLCRSRHSPDLAGIVRGDDFRKERSRRSRSDLWPPRRRSNCSATTAVGFSTPIRASVRKPERIVEHGRELEPARSSSRLRLRFRPNGGRSSSRTQPPGRDGDHLPRQPRDHLSERSRRQPASHGARRRSFRRKSGRQGFAFRAGGRCALRRCDHGDGNGRRQCDLRFAHALGGHRPDAQPPDGLHRPRRESEPGSTPSF